MKTVLGIHAGLSEPSTSEKLVSKILDNVQEKSSKADDSVEIETISLRNYASSLLNSLLTGFVSTDVETLMNKVLSASGLVLVSPVMSAGYSGLFKMFIDILPEHSLKNKPVLLGATAGTKRHSLVIDYAMKPVLDYHHARILSYSVFAATDDWGNVSELSERIDKAGDDLIQLLFSSNVYAPKLEENLSESAIDKTYQVNDSLFDGLTFHDLVNRGNND